MRPYAVRMEKVLLRVSEVIEATGLGRSKVYELIASGELPSVRIGGTIRVPVVTLHSWIKSRAASERASIGH